MVGVSMNSGYTSSMWYLLLLLLALGGPAAAGKDPDLKRKVPEGHQRFTGERLAVGAVAEAFLLQYPGHPEWQVSPSRYAVDFDAAAFSFRNRADYAVADGLRGQWLRVVFEVIAVTETAVEMPKGSGTWLWRLTYECDLRVVEAAER